MPIGNGSRASLRGSRSSLNTSGSLILNGDDEDIRRININGINGESTPLVPHKHDDSGAGGHGEGKVGPLLAIWNLFNDVLGPGTVTLPLYIMQAGLPAGAFLLLVFGFLTGYTLEDIYIMYMRFGKSNYPDLCGHILGKWGYGLICLAIFCFNFGGLVGQLMLFGSAVPDVMIDIFGPHRFFTKEYLILAGCVVFIPISFLKDIAKYTFTSFLSVSCIFLISFLVVFRLIDKKHGDYIEPDSSDHPYALIHSSAAEALGGLAYIYVCHDLSFNVIGSLENPTQTRYRRVVATTMLGTVAFCAMMGISGYLIWYHEVQPNILDSFPTKDVVATIGRILLALDVTLCIPFTAFMPRVSIILGLSALGKRPKEFAESQLGYSCITLLVLSAGVTVAIIVNNLGQMFELVGGVSACTIAFIFPPILIMKGVGMRNLHPFRKFMTILTLLCGIGIMTGTIVDIFGKSLWNDIDHSGHAHSNSTTTSTTAFTTTTT